MTINQQIEQWLMAHKHTQAVAKRPFVTLSYAQSWDGSITTRSGDTLALSSKESTRLTHQLRSLHDGILVGIGTVLSDNPQLTVREWAGNNPQPIILDSHLRLPPGARLCQHADKNCWVLTCVKNAERFDDQVEILSLEGDAQGHVNLHAALGLLWEKGIKMLMVEGGSQVITAFLKAGLANAIVLTTAPMLIGGYRGVGNLNFDSKSQLPEICPIYSQMLGNDLIMWGDLQYQEPVPC